FILYPPRARSAVSACPARRSSDLGACRPGAHRSTRPFRHGHLCVTISTVSIRVVEYVREDGSIPFKDWFDALDPAAAAKVAAAQDRKSTRLNSSHVKISYAVFCLK